MHPAWADADWLQLWEALHQTNAPRRMLVLLGAIAPDLPPRDAAALGWADARHRLLQWHRRSFGPALACVAACPACGEVLEFDLDLRALAATADAAAAPGPLSARTHDGTPLQLQLQLPTLAACAAAGEAPDAAQALVQLQRCCVRALDPQGRELPLDAVDAADLQRALDLVDEAGERAETVLQLHCPACAHTFAAPLEAEQFACRQVEQRALSLLAQVHTLARCHGWTEAEVLALSPLRRQHYLALALAVA